MIYLHFKWGGGYSKSEVDTLLNGKADTSHTHTKSQITDFPSYGTTANTICEGNDSRLSDARTPTSHTHTKSEITDFPTIPTVNNATLTIQKNGTTVKTFTANASSDVTCNITVPTKTSDLTNDSCIPLSGTNALSGSIVPNTDNAYNLGDSTYGFANFYTNKIYLKDSTIFKLVDDNYICIGGSTAQANGANLVLNGKNRNTSTGEFKLEARDGTNVRQLIGSPSGTLEWNGSSIVPTTDNTCDLGSSTYNFKNVYAYKLILKNSYIARTVNNDYLGLCGGTDYSNGAYFTLYGKDSTINAGAFRLRANNGTNSKDLIGKPDGTLSWDGDIIPNGNGAYDLGSTSYGFRNIYFNNTHSKIYYGGETLSLRSTGNGAGCGLGYAALYPSSDNAWSLGTSSVRWTQLYANSSTISTSDERQKDNIKQIDDKLLHAWGNVNIVQFNFKDALEKKGENARLHTGYIAQNIQQACEENGVNPNDYGLFCHDSWEEQEEKKDENGQVIEPYRPKGDLYSLRYEEALVVECAYLRKCIKELRAEIEDLKSSK